MTSADAPLVELPMAERRWTTRAIVTTIVPNMGTAEMVRITRKEITLIVPNVLLVIIRLVYISFTLFIKTL